MKWYLLLLPVMGLGCASGPNRQTLPPLLPPAPIVSTTRFSPQFYDEKMDSTIGLLNEIFLRPIGCEDVGEFIKELNRCVRKEILTPLDKTRRFRVGGCKIVIEADINSNLDKVTIQLTIYF